MSVPQEIQDLLNGSDFDSVEDAWLAHLADEPHDVAYFGAVGRALGRSGEAERARFLLEMVDDELRGGGAWEARLALLRHAGELYHDPGELHPAILATLAELHGSSPSHEQMVEKVGLLRAKDDVPKTWKKADRLAALLAFDVGSIVYLEGKGAGRVAEVNMALESFKVELDQQGELRVGFGGAAKILQPLAPGHVLRQKLEEPEALAALHDTEPAAALLRRVLESYDEPRTGAEVRRDLVGIVDDDRWNAWWTAARKHPQVLSAPGGRRAYSWAATQDDAQGAVWQAFEAAEPRSRLDLLRRNAGRDPDLVRRMSEALTPLAAEVVEADPGLACEIYFALERYAEAPADVSWSPDNLVARLTDKELLAVTDGIQERPQRQRVYQLAREKRPDYSRLAVQLLWREADARALDSLEESLRESAPELFGGFFDQILSRPQKSPAAFTWLVERAAERPDWLRKNPPRLLKQFLWSLTSEAFATFRSRLQSLVESGGTLPRLLAHLSEEQAPQAVEALQKTAALADYQRKPLLNAVYLRFPSLRQEEALLYATVEAIAKKREELRQIAREEIPANRRAIEEARELGDLRENFEYKSARQRHEYLSARATALDRDLRRVRPIDPTTVQGNEVVIGSRVTFEGEDGKRRTLTILGPWDSLPEEDILSNESELAKSLLSARPGQEVDLGDGEAWRVAAIEPAL